jgi:hypothetical protein
MTGRSPFGEPEEALGDPEVLEVGSSRARWLTWLTNPSREHSRLYRGLGVGVALAAGLVVGLATHTNATREVPPSKPYDISRISMTAVRALANQHGAPVNYVRETSAAGACRIVAVGRSPKRVISAAVRKAFPGYAYKDSAMTLDEFTALCSIEVRATYGRAVLLVRIASPTIHTRRAAYTQLETGIETDGDVTTKYALALNPAGWTVLVGATGPIARLPRAEDLMRFAQDPSLTW